MSNTSKLPADLLKDEIEKQSEALRRLRHWINICLLISSVGILLFYLGFSSDPKNYYFLVPGVILTVLGILGAVVIGYGHHNGKRNVEKMINILEKQIKKSNKKKK